jgi:hypothetical protein
MLLVEKEYVLIQDLHSRPGDPVRSYPQTLQVVKDMMTKITHDNMSTSIPLFFPKNPPGTAPAVPALEQEQGHPLARSDLNGSPRIALAVPPRSVRRA